MSDFDTTSVSEAIGSIYGRDYFSWERGLIPGEKGVTVYAGIESFRASRPWPRLERAERVVDVPQPDPDVPQE